MVQPISSTSPSNIGGGAEHGFRCAYINFRREQSYRRSLALTLFNSINGRQVLNDDVLVYADEEGRSV